MQGKGNDDEKPTHQIYHIDICNSVGDGYSVSNNPKLYGHGKPGSILIPLSQEGRQIVMGTETLTVNYGEALVWEGDNHTPGLQCHGQTMMTNAARHYTLTLCLIIMWQIMMNLVWKQALLWQ